MSTYLIKEKEIEDLKITVNAINEKYGVPKRWRAKEGEKYFLVSMNGLIEFKIEVDDACCKLRYDLGNYFKTKEEAQKVIDSKEWQDFWAKVRAGEIGND